MYLRIMPGWLQKLLVYWTFSVFIRLDNVTVILLKYKNIKYKLERFTYI